MIRHIIMFKFTDVKNDIDKDEYVNKMKTTFSPLRDIIPVVKSYEIIINTKKTAFSYDLAIISEYNSWDDLETYLNHPKHKEAIKMCSNIQKEKAVFDYEL